MDDVVLLANAHFVALTTFRRSGEPVATPVWVARDGSELLVLTPKGSGKVKRLRADPRVELAPCSRFGAVAPGAVVARGTASVVEDAAPARRAVAAKHPVEHRVVLGIERAVQVLRRRPPQERVTLRIRLAA
jgi:PPOX class probable F420-dependent enzyme